MSNLKPFQDFLPIPDVVKPSGSSSKQHLTIQAEVKHVKLHKDLPKTKVWCYRREKGEIINDGSGSTFLGPTIQVNRGDHVHLRWQNNIDASETLPYEVVKVPYIEDATPVPQNSPGIDANALTETEDKLRGDVHNLQATLVTHLHGGRTQADSDGWPDNTAISGQSADYTYQNDQNAAMLWYHDHANHVTRLNVFAGLAGVWLIRDDEEASLGLPDGDFELPLVLQDRNLDLDSNDNFTGALLHKTEVTGGPAEFFGPYTLVNGKIWPKTCVEPRLYRFRVLNGSNARTYRLVLLDDLGNILNNVIYQIGCDQGLMKNKTTVLDTGLILSPGERVDLLIDFSGLENRQLYFWNIAEAPFSGNVDAEPNPAQIQAELANLRADPFAFATSVTVDTKSSEVNRRYYPQVMRFDVTADLSGSSHTIPDDPLVLSVRPDITFAPPPGMPSIPIRLMVLVEKPAETTNLDGTPKLDGTAMLVFWEYVEVDPATPPGPDFLTFNYVHPVNGADVKVFQKAAEGFYDQLNWRIHLGCTEQWYIVNVSPDTHPIHVHLVDMKVNQRFQIAIQPAPSDPNAPPLEIDGNVDTLSEITATVSLTVDLDQTGPKDTVRINPGEMIGVAMKFSPFCGKYMYHCHILEHEDHDMMRPFVVVPKWIPGHDH